MKERAEEIVISRDDLQFNVDTYEKCLKIFDGLDDHLGMKLYLHAEQETLEKGQIFLFNHFARFETVIPVYIFYKHLRAFTRTIADANLFAGKSKLGRFLLGAGAIPNNMDGLLPFLAAEILKGRKVVIFPEGRMVKSKQVVDEEGQFGIFSQSLQSFRKHHTGAAVLALTLDLFKHRIKELFKADDQRRLDHWCQALEFSDHEQLRSSVDEPTLIVPGTITFSPIRLRPNIIAKAVKLFSQEISPRTLEEIIIEGNILLRDTDMDIRLGEPIRAHHQWSWWEDRLVKSYFLSIHSLDEFFSLKKRSETWTERLLSRVVYRETNKLRDAYIQGIYRGVTVNIGHIVSVLIYLYLEQDYRSVSHKEFHQVLYTSIKELQNLPDIHLHYNLNKPEKYRKLLNGKDPDFEQFIKTAGQVGLLMKDKERYHFKDKLLEEYDSHSIRLENPVQVCANEVEPLSEVKSAISLSLKKAREETPQQLAYRLWDDELRDYAWLKERFSRPEYDTLNQHEIAVQSREPYLLLQKDKSPGVLLVHGLISSPPELSAYGEHLHKQGYNVLGMRLSGHGTSPYDLNGRHWEDWYESVERNYRILAALSAYIYVVGFSTGGTLSLLLSSNKPEKLKAVVTVCAAIKLREKKLIFAPMLNLANRVSSIFPRVDGILNYRKSGTLFGETNYQHIPISALSELVALIDQARKNFSAVSHPLLLIQSDNDIVVEPESATIIYEAVAAKNKKLHWVKSDQHQILRNGVEDTWEVLDAFLYQQEHNQMEEGEDSKQGEEREILSEEPAQNKTGGDEQAI
ncbi:MAG: hypothetical protein CMQ38_10725 [Gammaproteobacteria bacterium]|nr:hypothetical protein [Gammaproteobacteria bacterium]